MRYLPHTKEDIDSMLKKTGCESIDELFDSIPAKLKTSEGLDLPASLTEWELNAHMEDLASQNIACKNYQCFMGAGNYDHYIPASVQYLISRSEFATAYTPYQPEVSQGTLQGIYEFQTMICELLGMDVATASHYDCGTAMAEACLIALRKNRKTKKIAVSNLVHPYHRQIVNTYITPSGFELVEIPSNASGLTDIDALAQMDDIAGVVVQSPNFLGNIENLAAFKQAADDKKAMFISSFTEALAYGLLKSPGSLGAEIVAGEGQSLGLPKSFGGPGLGLLAGTKKQMRNLPGRLIGKTTDANDQEGFVLTLATREQHIRREKASSNICSNNGLNAMTAAMYLSSVGKIGIRDIAQLNHDKAAYLKSSLMSAGFESAFDAPFFNEFVLKVPEGFAETRSRLINENCIFAGLDLEPFYPELKNHYLFCATETVSKDQIDQLAKEVQS
ncbi:MAG: aminomethyl-transferring glycine dehydrogenase subunit GcvPA [Desulfobacteraceae bacterium]|nr:MAG: aminomethyl-transferring glycine dehydrogenase subunit GcvPA [Desulfobacteraceae bacterium]